MSRWKASAIHLAISLGVLLTLGTLLSLTWYPPEYLAAVGGLGLIGILAGVDATLGPLLTLVVFDANKPGIKFDLAVIAVLQVLALGYGLHTIFLARPVYVVFGVDRFALVTASEMPPENLAKVKREEFKSLPLAGPEIVAVKKPEDPKELEKLMFAAMGGLDLQHFPQHFIPYAEATANVLGKARPLDELAGRSAPANQVLAAFLRDRGLASSRVKYLPLRSTRKDQTVLVDAATAEVLRIVDLDPW